MPEGDNALQMIKCRSNGLHAGEWVPLWFDRTCKVMSDIRGGRRPYPWQECVPSQILFEDVTASTNKENPFVKEENHEASCTD